MSAPGQPARNIVPCPYSEQPKPGETVGCLIHLQRPPGGDLIRAVELHLTVVHGTRESVAGVIARRWVRART